MKSRLFHAFGAKKTLNSSKPSFQPHLPPASFPPPNRPRRRRPYQAGCTPASLTGISESLHGGACHSLPHPLLSNRDAAASNVGSNWRPQILTTSPVKLRGYSQPSSAHELRIPMGAERRTTWAVSANRHWTSRSGRETRRGDKMAAAASQGGRSGGGGGGSGVGGGPSCGTSSSRTGLLDKVRN